MIVSLVDFNHISSRRNYHSIVELLMLFISITLPLQLAFDCREVYERQIFPSVPFFFQGEIQLELRVYDTVKFEFYLKAVSFIYLINVF